MTSFSDVTRLDVTGYGTRLEKTVKKFTRQIHGKYIVSFGELLIYWANFIREKKTTQLPLIRENG